MGTPFTAVYNRFLGKITDDMYLELTPEDTIRDLRNMLINIIPEFEFPRKNLTDYTVDTVIKPTSQLTDDDFSLGVVWGDLDEEMSEDPNVLVEASSFNIDLSSEEINILAILMMGAWLQRQITSIENTRQLFSGTEYKMTSQANHLSKLMTLATEVRRQGHHVQRLYGRRRLSEDGRYESNWSVFR